MEWVKTTAKTLPEAIDLALDNLGVDESEAEIVVLEEPRTGLFGRTRGIARVEARVKPKQSRPKAERNRNRNRRNDGESGRNRNRKSGNKSGGRGQKGEASSRERSDDRSEARSGSGQRGGQGGKNKSGSERSDQGSVATSERSATNDGERSSNDGGRGSEGGGGRGRSRNRRRSNNGNGGGSQGPDRNQKDSDAGSSDNKADNRSKSSSGPKKDREAAMPSQDASVEEVSAHLGGFLEDLVEAFGYDTDVVLDTSEGDDSVVGRIEERIGLLVGPKGRTLDAVQELARISCQRAVPSNVRIKVDVGGYRTQRAEALAEFARSAADRAVADGVEVGLEPMSAPDRKAVHDALNEDDRVTTRSVGVDPRRRILVVPIDTGDDAGTDDVEDVDEVGDEEE